MLYCIRQEFTFKIKELYVQLKKISTQKIDLKKKSFQKYHKNLYVVAITKLSSIFYFKTNELIQSSDAGNYFLDLTPAKNTSA